MEVDWSLDRASNRPCALSSDRSMLLTPRTHVAGVMISREPHHAAGYQGEPGKVNIYGIETRLPDALKEPTV